MERFVFNVFLFFSVQAAFTLLAVSLRCGRLNWRGGASVHRPVLHQRSCVKRLDVAPACLEETPVLAGCVSTFPSGESSSRSTVLILMNASIRFPASSPSVCQESVSVKYSSSKVIRCLDPCFSHVFFCILFKMA